MNVGEGVKKYGGGMVGVTAAVWAKFKEAS